MPIYTVIDDVITNQVLPSTYLNQILFNLELLSKHDHSPSSGEGNKIVTSASGASPFVERQYYFLGGGPATNDALELYDLSGANIPDVTSASEMLGGIIWGFDITKNTALNDWYGFQCPLIKGIYQLQMTYLIAPGGGAASIELGTSGLGLVDTYAASVGSVLIKTFSSIQITATASYLLRVIQTSSNTLSSSTVTKLGGWTLVKMSNG